MKKATALLMALIMVMTVASFPAFAVDMKKIDLTEENITIIRTFDSGWQETAKFYNPENLVDDDRTSYAYWDQYKEIGTTADMCCDVVVDLGSAKDISKVSVYAGVEALVGAYWTDNPAPMNAEILVAGEDEEYTSVYTYDADYLDVARTDSVSLDPTANGANVRYIKYTFNKVGRHATISEFEVYEAVFPEPEKLVPIGANIRLASDKTSAGLRFAATVNRKAAGITELWTEAETGVEFGMFLLPTNLLGEYKTLAEYVEAGETLAVDVPAKKIYAYDNSYVTYTAVLTDIPDGEYGRQIVAAPYMLKDGEYTFFTEQKNSYSGVAKAALDSYNNGNPNNITEEQVAALEKIVGEVEDTVGPQWIDIQSIEASLDFVQNEWNDISVESMIDGVNRETWDNMWKRYEAEVEQDGYIYLDMDLGKEYNLTDFFVRFGGQMPVGIILLGTNDGTDWNHIATLNSTDMTTQYYGEEGGWTTVNQAKLSHNGGYRYIQCMLLYSNGGVSQIYEIAFKGTDPRDVEQDQSVAINVASASVYGADGSGDNYIIDGDYNSKYSSSTLLGPDGNPVVSVEFDLGAKYELTEFTWITDCGALKGGTIYATNDPDGSWTPIKSFRELSYTWDGSYNWKGYNVQNLDTSGIAYRYVKIDVTTIHSLDNEGDLAWDDPNFVEINEVEFRGIPHFSDGNTSLYYDIDVAAAKQGLDYDGAYLPAYIFADLGTDYSGYKIDGNYLVDEDTLRMLTTVDVVSSEGQEGTIKYVGYTNFTNYISNKVYGAGCGPHSYGEQIINAPVSKLSDPLYMSMVLPSEGVTYQGYSRTNGNNMHKACNVVGCTQCNQLDFKKLNPLGALYINHNNMSELEDYKDVQFKICLGNIRLLVNTPNDGWQQVSYVDVPTTNHGTLYCLPWQLEWNSATADIYYANCKTWTDLTPKTDYVEIGLTVGDFFHNKTFTGTDGQSYTIDERVLHFWGDGYIFENDADILGLIAAYDIWIEYDESIGINLEDYFIASIGADWRTAESNSTVQAFAGYKHAISTEKITVFGHNIGPSDYDTLVTAGDLEYIKGILGIQ